MTQPITHDTRTCNLASINLLEQVGYTMSVFFNASWAIDEDAKPGPLRLAPDMAHETALRRDYSGMREVIIGNVPGFDDLTSAVATYETEINSR